MMKSSVELVHEYIADEGVLSTGVDKLKYQALLLNQVSEERLICLSSSFNQSLIKKRMIMMTRIKSNQKPKLGILALIPLAALLFFAVACVNGEEKLNSVTAIETVQMNVLYVGVDNSVKIAVTGFQAQDLLVSVNNGTISGENGKYVICPKKEGETVVSVYCNGEEVQKTSFKTQYLPDPLVSIAGKDRGTVSKKELIGAKEMKAQLDGFLFNVDFEISEFVIIAIVDGITHEIKTETSSLSDSQQDIISELKSGSNLIFDAIKCKGSDGLIRDLAPFVLKIEE